MNRPLDHGRTAIESALAWLSSDAILRFFERQRWYGAKGAAGTTARVLDAVVMPWGLGAFAIARITVETSGDSRTYQVPLAARDALPANMPESVVVARGEPSGKHLVVYDALYDPDFRQGLVRAIRSGIIIPADGGPKFVIERAVPDTPGGGDPPSRIGTAEQSNTSLIIGDDAILKLFRILNPGPQPDVEVSLFLTMQAGFTHTPQLLASLRFEDANGATTAGMLQEYLGGSTDAWAYTMDRSRSYFTAPANREAPNAFVEDAIRLGTLTRELHEALGSLEEHAAFSPEPAEPEDLDRWAHRAQHGVNEALTLLERQIASPAFPRERLPEAQALLKRREHFIGWINEIADHVGEDLGLRIRTHGDYHLGQILRTKAGEFMVIDFEGEPSKPLEERREKTSPLRDVAGMLRSFSYAAATLAATDGRSAPPAVRELRAARWERDVRSAFLGAYFAQAEEEYSILPESETNSQHLVTLFETEKAFYELAYELNNRPDWSWIPMRGISKLFVAK